MAFCSSSCALARNSAASARSRPASARSKVARERLSRASACRSRVIRGHGRFFPLDRRGFLCVIYRDVNPDGAGAFRAGFLNFLSFHRDGGGNGGRRGGCGLTTSRCPRSTLGALPPPLWGRAGEGGGCCRTDRVRQQLPPPPTPPHKGEGSRPSLPREDLPISRWIAGSSPAMTVIAGQRWGKSGKARTVFGAWQSPAMTVLARR